MSQDEILKLLKENPQGLSAEEINKKLKGRSLYTTRALIGKLAGKAKVFPRYKTTTQRKLIPRKIIKAHYIDVRKRIPVYVLSENVSFN